MTLLSLPWNVDATLTPVGDNEKVDGRSFPVECRRLVSAPVTLAIAVLAYACSAQGIQPTKADVLSVHALNDAKGSYVAKNIAVEGKVYVLTLSNLLTCQAEQPCPRYSDALLTLADAGSGQVSSPEQLVRLYRRSPVTGVPEQIHCKIVDQNTPRFDCGAFVNGTVVTIDGTFTRDRVPDQVVGDSTGRIEVVSYRDVYYLLVS